MLFFLACELGSLRVLPTITCVCVWKWGDHQFNLCLVLVFYPPRHYVAAISPISFHLHRAGCCASGDFNVQHALGWCEDGRNAWRIYPFSTRTGEGAKWFIIPKTLFK